MNAHVYAIATDDGFIKIGVSFNPAGRLKLFQTGNHRKLRLAMDSPVIALNCDPFAIEHEIHKFMAPRRSSGEWFFATLDHVHEAIQEVQHNLNIIRPALGQAKG